MSRLLVSLKIRGFESDLTPRAIDSFSRADMVSLGEEMILWLKHTRVALSEGEALSLRMISREYSLSANDSVTGDPDSWKPAGEYLTDLHLKNAVDARHEASDARDRRAHHGERGGKVGFEALIFSPSKNLMRNRAEAIPTSYGYGARATVFFDKSWSLRGGVETWDDTKAFNDSGFGEFLDEVLKLFGAPRYNYTFGYLKSIVKTIDLRYHISSESGKISTFFGIGYAGLDMKISDELRLKDGTDLFKNTVEARFGGADLIFGLEHFLTKMLSISFESRYRIAKKRIFLEAKNVVQGTFGKVIPAPQYDDLVNQYVDYFNFNDKIFENEGILVNLSLNLTFGN